VVFLRDKYISKKGNLRMIVVKLKGGLGNQLFQYAAAKQISIKFNTPLVLDLSFFESKSQKHTSRIYELDKFNIDTRVADYNESKKINSSPLSKIRLNKLTDKNFWFKQYFIRLLPFGYVRGFWQSEKYFIEIKHLISESFTFKKPLDYSFSDLEKQIDITNSVSIHFRRGDYVTNEKANKHHGVTSLEYYTHAIEYINQQVKDAVFFVFSDDIEWVKLNFSSQSPLVFVDKSDQTNHSDFRLMLQCKHNIIANSTYSWWAAWLNKNADKIVIAPQKWYNDSKNQQKLKDIIPYSWILL